MKVGLFGYGKMGKTIEKIAQQQGLEIAWRIGTENRSEFSGEEIRRADVVIEFTRPESGFENVMACLDAGVPVVSGTTGWNERLPEAQKFCLEKNGALLWASNFSVGVNLFFALNQYLAKMMNARPEYDVEMTEIHHIHKLDAPSGTAISLANDILREVERKEDWVLKNQDSPGGKSQIPIEAIRENEVPGTHSVRWFGSVDEIFIEHKAHSREGFAAGAVFAARWLVGRRGVFSMADVLGI